ncbi:MAG: serpin family protein, partial [bacterium]
GKIPTIIENIPTKVVMYLINAVYFKGMWTTQFDKKLTENREFTFDDGRAKMHPLMKIRDHMPYLESDEFQSVRLSYGDNERLAMYVFLPKNLESFVKALNIREWDQWMSQYHSIEGTILLPKFKMSYGKELKDILSQMGMGIAFSDFADFSNIPKDNLALCISAVEHKTFIEVNEEGTEAAAITSVGVGITSVSPITTFYMEVNRPFFYVIRDCQTGEILFMGIVQEPEI